jgi:predicted RNA-binding protein (virulence factor B family)
LRVNYVNQIGAFMDWGMEKTFWFRLKRAGVLWKKGNAIWSTYMDEKTNRLVAQVRRINFLKNEELLKKAKK